MKVDLLRKMAAILSLATTLGLGAARAENVKLASYWSEEANAALAESNDTASAGGACCGSACGGGSCCDSGNACCGGGSCCDTCCSDGCSCRMPAVSECCPLLNIIGFAGLDTFRGLPDQDWPGNFGVVNGVNAGAPLPVLSRYGIGGQFGASYGIYDLQGRLTGNGQRASSQEQIFITNGLFRRADAGMPFNFGVAYDMMINDNLGENSDEPYLGQWRGLIGYCLSARNEIGWWGAFHDRRDTQGGRTYRTVQQNNMYWHHNFLNGADSWLWVGIPERNRLNGRRGGSLYEWNLGGLVNVPLTQRTGIYGNFAYFCPSAPAGTNAAVYAEAWQVGVGLSFFPGATSRNSTVAGRAWAPLMPLANNGTMAIDTSFGP